MDDTSLENTFTCQPQMRNVHGRVFGGFLMRCATWQAGRRRPRIHRAARDAAQRLQRGTLNTCQGYCTVACAAAACGNLAAG